MWQDEIQELWECGLIDHKRAACVAAAHVLVAQHVVPLVRELTT